MSIISSMVRKATRSVAVLLALGLLVSTASAYSLVLKSGRVVVIPEVFSATGTTLTYEVSPSIQITVQLSAIDIPATDRANRATPGSFLDLLRTNQNVATSASASTIAGAKGRVVTNRDLESFASARRASEQAFEQRQRELGLPSKEELRRQAAAESAASRARLAATLADERAQESYWRDRATPLRVEIAAVDAEIGALRQQLDLLPLQNTLSSTTVVSGLVSSGLVAPFGQAVVNPAFQRAVARPRVFVAPSRGPASRISTGPVGLPNSGFHRRVFAPFFQRGFGNNQFPFFPVIPGGAYQSYDLSYDRTILMTRLNELIARRAALAVEWRDLEDDARRSGAYPGWLRP